MKKYFSSIAFIILGAVIMAALMRECDHQSETIKWKAITSVKDSIVEIPVDKTHDKPAPTDKHDTVIREVDSAAIRNNAIVTFYAYNARYEYDLPILDDSTGKYNLVTSVQFNQLGKYRLVGHGYVKYRIKTTERTIPAITRNKVFIGASLASDRIYLSTSADLYLVTKRDNLYQASIDPFKHIYKAGTAVKIRLRK